MVDFVRLQQIMKERLDADRAIKTIEADGADLDEAVRNASALLNCPVRRIEFEVLEHGSVGFFGSGARPWKIRAYEIIEMVAETVEVKLESETPEFVAPLSNDRDGDLFIQLSQENVFLKVTPPIGRGRRATFRQAMEALKARAVHDLNEDLVNQAIRNASGEYVNVGSFIMNPLNDAVMTIDITEQEMKAFIYVTPPGPGGCDISAESIMAFLRNNRVIHGIDTEYIKTFADRPTYKQMVLVAEGTKPVNGADAYMEYYFETDPSKVKLREGTNGRVDFKELNIIQNVVEDQPLARKVPAQRGVTGKTITGKVLPSKNGKDIPLPIGKNVHASDDKLSILADLNGQVLLLNEKVNVEPILTIQGDVNLKTGHIIFLGTVVITGNVEDSFSVKATGNIEVHGTVGKAELDAEGDIIVHQGIAGKSAGIAKAGRSVWARFIENANIEAGALVVVSDGIINSQVDANKKIICQGKRAHIVGGQLRAAEEINAKIIGSPVSGTETICEVGYDPKSKEELKTLDAERTSIEKQLEEIQLNLQTLMNIRKQRKSLPEDKEAALRDLVEKRQEFSEKKAKLSQQIDKLQNYLNNLRTRGRVSASSKVYPGVKIVIRDIKEDVKNEYRSVTFILDNNLIRVTKYEETDEDLKRGPDGYTTD